MIDFEVFWRNQRRLYCVFDYSFDCEDKMQEEISNMKDENIKDFIFKIAYESKLKAAAEEYEKIHGKEVEFSFYRNAPQVRETVTNGDRAARKIRDMCDEMDNRYSIFAEKGVRDISSYNEVSEVKMPRIVVFVEELADLVISQGSEVIADITRLVVKARACGIHVVLATQRPEAEFMTGKLRSNFQCRVAFSTATNIDSRIILGRYGAEKLKGLGDGIFRSNNGQKNTRFQSALVTEREIKKAVSLLQND